MNLRQLLEPLFLKYHDYRWLSSDPLEFLHHYPDSEDQEIVGIYAALLAYGNVRQIRASIQNLLRRIEGSTFRRPRNWIQELGGGGNSLVQEEAAGVLTGFVHRFHGAEEMVLLGKVIFESRRRYGSIGQHFCSYLHSRDFTIETALGRFLSDWKDWSLRIDSAVASKLSYRHLLSSPQDGSCCKRWLMFLRWMGRKDDLDPGTWVPLGLSPRQLVIPLDTHTGRISQYLGLTERKSLNWKAALEITERLKTADPEDPVKYDFALARLGILSLCQKKYRKEICDQCDLLGACRFAQAQRKSVPSKITGKKRGSAC